MSPTVGGATATETAPAVSFDLVGGAGKGAPARAAPLLPEPSSGGLDGAQSALSMLYGLMARQGALTLAMGEAGVSAATREQDAQIEQERHAQLQELQQEAQGGFWHDLLSVAETVAKIAGLVVTVAAGAVGAVFTGGATAIAAVAIAGALVSGGLIVGATHCLGDASEWVAMGLEIVASVVTLGATSGAVAGTASDAATTVAGAGRTVGGVAEATQGAATAIAGGAGIATANIESKSELDAADVQQALNLIQKQSRIIESLVEGLKSSEDSNQHALQLVAGVAATYDHTMIAAASGGRA